MQYIFMINKKELNIFLGPYRVHWLVCKALLMLLKRVEVVGHEELLGLIGEEDRVAVEGHAQHGLRHLRHLLRREHGGRSDPWWRCGTFTRRFAQLIRTLFPESIVSLSGSRSSSYEHCTIFTPTPESIVA